MRLKTRRSRRSTAASSVRSRRRASRSIARSSCSRPRRAPPPCAATRPCASRTESLRARLSARRRAAGAVALDRALRAAVRPRVRSRGDGPARRRVRRGADRRPRGGAMTQTARRPDARRLARRGRDARSTCSRWAPIPTTSSSAAAARSRCSPAPAARVGIVHLTSGEAGTRGTAEDAPARGRGRGRGRSGVAVLEILDCGDGGLRTGRAEEDALIEVLRRLRPRLVLGPPPSDRHPDHGRAHALLRDACFYAGLAKRSPERGAPHRPAALFCYLQHDLAVPTFVVDVTAGLGAQGRRARRLRVAALARRRAGRGARSTAPPGDRGAPTFVSSPEFRLSIEARARHFGVGIGATYGEGFLALGPLAVTDPLDLVPGGLTLRVGIACHPTVGGSGVVATELARALAEGGDEVHFMSYAVPPRWTWAGPATLLPRGGGRAVPAVRVPALRPRARHQDGRGGAPAPPRPPARPLRGAQRGRRRSWRARSWRRSRSR